MNEQSMRPPAQLPYQMWEARPGPLPPAGFVGGKPTRRAWKRAARQPWKRSRRGGAAAPRNTTSFLIRAKRAGGVASLVSPCPVTPAVLPTPQLSPAREVVVEMAKEAWGVDGYGSMKGLIRLRSPAAAAGAVVAAAGEDDSGCGESDLEDHVEVERRLDHDLSRFEMVQLPAAAAFDDEARASRLEEENLTLRDSLFLMERDVAGLRDSLFLMERDMAHIRRRLIAVEGLCRDRHGNGCVVDNTDESVPSESVAGEQAEAMEN